MRSNAEQNEGLIGSLMSQLATTTQSLEESKAALETQREQFQAVLDAVPGGVSWIGEDGIYLGINRRLAGLYGMEPADFVGKQIGFMNNSPDFAAFAHEFVASPESTASREMKIIVSGKPRYYLLMAQKYGNGQSSVFVGIDITERKLAEEQLFHNAFYDSLTGLANRSLLFERIARALLQAKRNKQFLFAVLFLDCDGFKAVNDTWGHNVGDLLLVELARRLTAATRAIDTVARLGGDEFVILLENITDVSDATLIAERIQQSLAQPFALDDFEASIGASIGIALNKPGHHNANDILHDADLAMYRAKNQGRNRYEVTV